MSTIVSRRARRIGSLGASLAVIVGLLAFASPAQAAIGVELTVSDGTSAAAESITVTAGESITLSWTSTDAIDLVASGQWSGNKTVSSGDEIVTPTTTGTYTLLATDANGRESTDSVQVTVVPGPITPNPVTFPDPCTVVIPATPNVTYFVIDDGDETTLTAGTLDGTDYSDPETPVTFVARANQGFTLAPGAIAQWDYTAPDSCFDLGPELVTTTVTCGAITFTNTTNGPVDVVYGSIEEDDADGEFTLAAGATHKITTKRPEIVFFASSDFGSEGSPFQIRFVEVPQNCGDGDNGTGDESGDGDSGSGSGSDHPTVAPAAGIAAR